MARRRTILDQVYPLFLISVFLVVSLSVFISYRVFRDFRAHVFREQLHRESELVALLLSAEIAETDDAISELLPRLGRFEDLPLRLFNPEGEEIASTVVELPSPPEGVVQTVLWSPDAGAREYRDASAGVVHLLQPVNRANGRYVLVLSRSEAVVTSELSGLVSNLVLTGLVILLVSSGLLAHMVRRLQAPLETLQRAASAYADGRLNHRFQVSRPQEMALLAETMNGMAEQLTSRIRAISSQRNQLEAMLSGMTEGVLLVDSHGYLRTINEAACRLFSVTEEAAIRQPLIEAVRNSELYDFYRETLENGETTEGGIRVYRESARFLQAHGTVIQTEGEPDVLIVLNDITRIKRLEGIRQDFVANVSHELKTPITSILGFVETLIDGAVDDPEEARSFLRIVATHTRRLNAIIDDLLQLARLEHRQEELPLDEMGAEEVILRAMESCSYAAGQKGITVRYSVGAGAELIEASRSLLERALTNLLDNAVKYAYPETTVTLRAESARSGETGRAVRLSVADEGPGIPPVEQARVFERFYRVDKARSRKLGGTGLGLAIVKHVALVHGGSVDLESERGRGSTFILTLPQGMSPLHDPEHELQGADNRTE